MTAAKKITTMYFSNIHELPNQDQSRVSRCQRGPGVSSASLSATIC